MTVRRAKKKKNSSGGTYTVQSSVPHQVSIDSSFEVSSEIISTPNEMIDCVDFVKPIDFRDEICSCIEPLKNSLSYCEPCQCIFFLQDEPKNDEDVLVDAREAYECSSDASSAFVSIVELDETDCKKMVEAANLKEFRKRNAFAMPFKDDYLTVKTIKEKPSVDESDSLESVGIKNKEDINNRYARPGWITGLHDPIGLGAYEWEKLLKSIIGQDRYGRNSSREPFFRFELPINLEYLAKATPLNYLEKYCKVSDRRMALYQKEFTKYKDSKGVFISRSNLFKALNSIMVGTLSSGQFSYITDLLEITEDKKISIKAFVGICAVTERLFFSKNLTSTSEESLEIQKGYIEVADFTNMTSKLRTIKVPANVEKLLRAL